MALKIGVMGYYKINKMRKMECPRLCWHHEMSIGAFGGVLDAVYFGGKERMGT